MTTPDEDHLHKDNPDKKSASHKAPPDAELLSEARRRAARLLEQLLHHQGDLRAHPTSLPPDLISAGERSLRDTVDAMTHLLHTLDRTAPKDDK